MRFKMDGEQFELTAEMVRDRLRGRPPGDIRRHWVEVDGVRWPVKQAFSVATGADTGRFVSTTARRHFANLGFLVSTVRVPRSAAAAPRSPKPTSEPLVPADTVSLELSFTWMTAGELKLDRGGIPAFPTLPHLPGLYRFDLHGGEAARTRIYIGESVDLARRASNYRNAKTDRSRQRTSRRIHRELVAHLAVGGTITYSIVTEVTIGGTTTSADLRLKSARRLAENVAVLLAQMAGAIVLNIDADLSEPNSDDGE